MLFEYIILLAFVCGCQAEDSKFCSNGIPFPAFRDDRATGVPSIEVIVAQAPLSSATPSIGQKLKYINAFHTALVFAQHINGTAQYWTLEFESRDPTMIKAFMPRIDSNKLLWDASAYYCLSEGILLGREHWAHLFDSVLRMTAAQANQTFGDFIQHVNSSDIGSGPQYQLWNVANTRGWWRNVPTRSLIKDINCGDGVVWVLHYIATTLGIFPRTGFVMRHTTAVVPATAVEPADTNDRKVWADIIAYYTLLVGLKSDRSIFQKLIDIWRYLPVRYIYDTNSGTYYRVHGNKFPYMHTKLVERQLEGPPAGMWKNAGGLTATAGETSIEVSKDDTTTAALVV
jgi:hypothetical protein